MRSERLIRPGKRKRRADVRPGSSAASNPLHEYLVPPTDAKGRSISTHVGLAPSIPRLAVVLLLKSKLPFRTPQDVYRWAIHFGMEYLVRFVDDETAKSDWSQISAIMQVGALEMENLEYVDAITTTIKRVRRLSAAGHEVKAQQLADVMWRRGDQMDDPYWRKLYRTMAKKALDQLKRGEDVTIPKDEDGGERPRIRTRAKTKADLDEG